MVVLALLLLGSITPDIDIEAKLPVEQRWSPTDTPHDVLTKTLFRYDLCIFGEVRLYTIIRPSRENAATIADAALGNCQAWDGPLRVAMVAQAGDYLSSDNFDQLIAKYKTSRRPQLIGAVLKNRAARRH